MSGLVGVPGVAGGKIKDVVFAGSIAAVVRELDNHRAVMAGGDNGAITVYKDDDGNYRCDLSRWCVTKAEDVCKSKTAVKRFLKEHFHKIN